jgi:predicted dehydrogenase
MSSHANEIIGVGIVGASASRGWASVAHVPALRALNGFAIRAVSTTHIDSAKTTADRLDVALAFDNHQALVSHPAVDLVVVAVKVPDHYRIVSDALRAGKMVYCEWPLARNLAEAEDLARLAEAAGTKTVVGLQGAFNPPIRFLRDLVRGGAIGRPLSTSIRAHLSEPMWLGQFDPQFEFMAESAHGATMLSIAVGHALEPVAQVLGEFERVSALVVNQRGDGARSIDGSAVRKDAPDEIAAVGVLNGGVVASLHYSAGFSPGRPLTWEIQGAEGSLLVEAAHGGYLHLGELSITLREGQGGAQPLAVPASYARGAHGLVGGAASIVRMYAQLASDLQNATSTVPDFQTAVARHRVLNAISRAAASGNREDVHPF